MALPQETVSLHPDVVAELNRKLSDMRHNVNNQLTLVSTALELIRRKPDALERMLVNMADQPQRIREEVNRFSDEFERTLGITPDP